MGVTASDRCVKQPAESFVYTFNFTDRLDSDATETLSAITSVTELTTSDLTIGTAAINTGSITVDGATIAANMAVQARISGGTAGTVYVIECIATTSESNTLELDGELKVVDR